MLASMIPGGGADRRHHLQYQGELHRQRGVLLKLAGLPKAASQPVLLHKASSSSGWPMLLATHRGEKDRPDELMESAKLSHIPECLPAAGCANLRLTKRLEYQSTDCLFRRVLCANLL